MRTISKSFVVVSLFFLVLLLGIFSPPNLSAQWIQQNSGATAAFHGVAVVDSLTAIVVGSGGAILKTTDGGNHWLAKPSGTIKLLNAIAMLGTFGYAAGDHIICRTTDGGETWADSTVDDNYTAISMGIGWGTEIWIGSQYGEVLYSLDAGTNWSDTTFTYGSVVAIQATRGVYNGGGAIAVTHDSTYYTINDGASWYGFSNIMLQFDYLYGGDLRNDLQYLCGEGGDLSLFPEVFRKHRADTSWARLKTDLPGGSTPWAIKAFNNSPIVYTCGIHGVLYKSLDSGEHWTDYSFVTKRSLFGIEFWDTNHGYVVGDSGTILITSNGGVTSVNSSNVTLPGEVKLFPNYPNPFNPTTRIKYVLPSQSQVRLIIYNVLGQAVKIITNGNQQAGYQEAEWNASDVSSGVYFYRLEATSINDPAKHFSQARKLLLIK
ncbi:MAG: YCF48-related protein [Bacteroidota bacterium]